MKPEFDKVDARLLQQRTEEWNKRQGYPRVGDFVKLPDGTLDRFTHAWNDSIQTGGMGGSFYLERTGHASYSGGLDPGYKKNQIVDTGKTHAGRFWFFHHDMARAHNGVDVKVECRVYKVVE